MTGRKSAGRDALDQLVDFLVEDVLHVSDEDMLAEMRDERVDPDSEAARLRGLFENAVLSANKGRLHAARAAMHARKNTSSRTNTVFDIKEARRRLQSVLEQRAATSQFTMAARNESELSDDDVLSMVQDLEELGFLLPDGK